MEKQLFKGLVQVLSEPNMKFEPGFVYFVREDETKEHGFIYFNGKKYGTTKEVADKLAEVADKLATLEGVDVEERLKNLEDVSAETRISNIERVSASDGTRITNIENDYLKREDKTALEKSISDLSGIVNDNTVSDVVYDKSAETVYIKFKNNEKTVGFSVSDFIIDGMLSDVDYDTTAHTMTFVWNTDAGSKTETVNINDIISPYKADEKYIQLGEGNTFNAVIGVITFENGQFKSTSKGISDTDNLVGFLNKLLGNINAVSSRVATLEAVSAEVRTTANAADTLSKENKSRLDSIGLSVVDGKLCVTFNQ